MSDTDLDFDPEELAMLRQLFRSEAHDALEAVTARVLASGSTKPTVESLTEMMRVTHTLKGAAGTVGLNVMVDLTHRLESAFARIGRDATAWTAATADLVVEVTDGLRGYLDQLAVDPSAAEPLANRLREQIRHIARTDPARDSSPDVLERGALADPPSEPPPDRSESVSEPPPLNVTTRSRRTYSDIVPISPNESLTQPTRSTPDSLKRSPNDTQPTDSRSSSARRSVQKRPSDSPPPSDSLSPNDSLSMPSPNDSLSMLSAGDSLSMPTITELASPEGMPEPVLDYPSTDVGVPEPKSYLRVEPERIDALMSSAGELLFDRTRIERRVQLLRTLARDLARTRQSLRDAIASDNLARGRESRALGEAENELASQATQLSQTTAALLDEIEALRRTIGELQRGLVRIRMESARNLMTHAARTLRALRRATGVRVELRSLGEETEFDKAVAEQLIDPITQLLRNAVAHAIEPPEERAARGKPPTATITLRARQDGNLLVLEISDDGRGVDTAALRDRLVATSRWSLARAQLATDADVLDALGTGVSVRGDADELAGRGIGLDLVRQTVARLGGEVKVTSAPGRGTTFSMRLPLSTSLTQAMLFKVGGQVYAIPAVHVSETTIVEPSATTANVRQEQVPVLRLEILLGANTGSTDRRPGVVVSFAGKTMVCSVDKIVGPREIIIKPLGPLLAPLTLYAAATISGSGKVQLILDPAQLVRRVYPDAHEYQDPASAPMVLAGRALVVDDSRAIREAMTSMLGREGWIVDVAEDGARALQMTRQLRYDLIVTDLEMPELSGFELIARLRKDERFATTPIVIITSRANPEHRRRAKDLGVRALVAKPITRRKLLEALAAR